MMFWRPYVWRYAFVMRSVVFNCDPANIISQAGNLTLIQMHNPDNTPCDCIPCIKCTRPSDAYSPQHQSQWCRTHKASKEHVRSIPYKTKCIPRHIEHIFSYVLQQVCPERTRTFAGTLVPGVPGRRRLVLESSMQLKKLLHKTVT